jgi:hypothetical protein
MATYRVGEAGATVFNSEGRAIARLKPGYIVVEGTLESAKSLAAQHEQQAKKLQAKRTTKPKAKKS